MSAFCSTSIVRFCCYCFACGVCGQRPCIVHTPTGPARTRRGELSGARDDLVGSALAVEPGETAWTIENGERAISIFVHAHCRPDVVLTVGLGRNLKRPSEPRHAIIGPDDPILLHAQHLLDR